MGKSLTLSMGIKMKLCDGKIYIFWLILWSLFSVAALVGGEVYGLYDKLYWWDVLLHTLAGYMLYMTVTSFHKDPSFLGVFLIGCVVANVIVLWEVFEFFVDQYFDMSMQDDLNDTMEDILVGKLGCFSAVLYREYKLKILGG